MSVNIQTYSDEELMMQLQAGNSKCFELLYDRYHKRLFYYLKKFVKDTELAEDLLHDVFVKIYESCIRFDTNQKFSTWAFAIATNAFRNEYRNTNNRTRIIDTKLKFEKQSHISNDSSIDKSNFSKQVNTYIENLDEENKMLILLRFHEELTVPEISKILLIPEGTIKSRLFYQLKKMSQVFKEFNPAI